MKKLAVKAIAWSAIVVCLVPPFILGRGCEIIVDWVESWSWPRRLIDAIERFEVRHGVKR